VATLTCGGGSVSARREGDTIVLQNERVTATIGAAGAIVAFGPGGGMKQAKISVAAGVLPGDAAAVERTELVDESPGLVAAELTGGLLRAGDVRVTTRYELRPCEDGLRVRSELEHRGADVQTYALADVSVWQTPPPPLEDLPRASYPSVVVSGAGAAYGFVTCDGGDLSGVNEERVSALGAAPALVRPGERLLFERLLLTAGDDAGARAAIDRVRGR
jgi:hypothetical protein